MPDGEGVRSPDTQSALAFPWTEPTAASWSALAALGTLIVAATAAVFAWRQVNEAKRLRREQAEPYVAASLEFDTVTTSVDLVVKNFGSTAAYDVKLECSPTLQRSNGQAGVEEAKLPEVIKTLVPGQSWRTLLDFAKSRAEADLPSYYDMTVTFTSYLGRKRKPATHRYTYSLDLAALESTMFVVRYDLHTVAKELREVRKEVKRWTEGTKGLSVHVRDGEAKDARMRAELEEKRAQRRAQRDEAENSGEPGASSDHEDSARADRPPYS